MGRAPSIRGVLVALLVVVIALAALLSVVTALQARAATERTAAERQRVASFRLADGMRQSSNDLTRMVRLYVTTGDTRYRRYYQQILDIRSGRAPRPRNYDSSYWDRVLADGEADVRLGPPASLTELMRRARFSPAEFQALAASLAVSNHLAELELRTMRAVAPRLADGVDRDYLRAIAPLYDRMVDHGYHAEKRRIMNAIDRFTALVDARTARRARELQARTDRLLVAQTGVIVALVAALLGLLVVAARAVAQPLSRLADITRRITRGDWSQRARARGVRELRQLAFDFNEMADAVEHELAGRRRAEREARDAENRLQTIADRVPGAVFQFHVDRFGGFSVRFASRHGSIHRLAHNEDVDFPGMARQVLLEDRGAWLDSMLRAARDGVPWQLEYRVLTDAGEVAWMQGQAVTAPHDDGSAELYGYVADVTQRKALEADLRRAREDAEAADRAKSAFLAMMSHELRTPLVAVTGTLELLSLDALDARQRELVDLAMSSARALLAVIGDVLDFSRIEAGVLDLTPATVALRPLVSELGMQYRHTAGARGLALRLDVDEALAEAHVVDGVRLRQVLGNLLSNAVKFTRRGQIDLAVSVIEATPGSQRLAFTVTDTGIGISPEDQGRLFVPFTQASTENARSSEGSGLGLAICRQLVDAMGGTVDLRSSRGEGTVVRVELVLPIGRAADALPIGGQVGAAPGLRRALPSRAESAREGSLLLLVEDNVVNREVLRGQLEAIGFRVDVVEDAGHALEAFATGEHALVFTDIQLPHVDGYTLAGRLRQAERDSGRGRVPVLALTASALQDERERCRAAGMDDVVTKPTTMPILAGTLRRWLPHVAWPPPLGQEAPSATIDVCALDELTAGDPALGASILGSYATSVQEDLAGLRAAIDAGARDDVRRLAHQIAGASRVVGAHVVAERAERLEAAARVADAGTLADHAGALRGALHAVLVDG